MKQSKARRLARTGMLSEDFRCSIRGMIKDWNRILEIDAGNKNELKLKQVTGFSKKNVNVGVSKKAVDDGTVGDWGKFHYKEGKLEKMS